MKPVAHTAESAMQWAASRSGQLDKDRNECEDEVVKSLNAMFPKVSKILWDSGSWLREVLGLAGATEEEIVSIQMAQGQRSTISNPWDVAVDYANEYEATGTTLEKGGAELAEKVYQETFGK